jgi:manganese/zinc/iron transport system permease protein
MSTAQIEIQLIAMVVAAACALPGVFLILRRTAMMSDAISHTVLLGIVVTFFLTRDLSSPWLVLGATLMGVLTVGLTELLSRTRRVAEDAAIGLVFPALFSLAVILISRFAGDIHLDTDAVLLGELAFAPFDRFVIFGRDLGPVSLYMMGGILVINLAAVVLFFKELKLATFDVGLAAALGFSPVLIHYGLMTLVSITAVGAFDSVGSILVVALMIGPAASAYLLTDHLERMILLSVLIGAGSAVGGFWLASLLDANIAGSMATMVGLVFGMVFALAPERGLLAIARRRVRQRWEFATSMLTIHLLNHEGSPEALQECRLEHMEEHMRWDPAFAQDVTRRAVGQRLVEQDNGFLMLTELGRERARKAMTR